MLFKSLFLILSYECVPVTRLVEPVLVIDTGLARLDFAYLAHPPLLTYTESHQTYRTIHHTSNNANTCTKCKASVKGSSPSHVSIVLSTTQPGLRQQCYEKPIPL